MLNRIISSALVLVCLGALTPLAAQERRPQARTDSIAALDLPPAVAHRVVEFFNDPHTLQLTGPARIPAERTIEGDVAVLRGPVVIAGRVDGHVAVINGDVELQPGARIAGDLIVVGGQAAGLDDVIVGGEVLVFAERLQFVMRGDRIATRRQTAEWRRGRTPAARAGGRSDFVVATGRSYNRVEGLPVTFGPVIETAGANPLRLRAMGIYRSESGATLEDLGYHLRAEQYLGGHRELRIGASYFSEVDPIEDWFLTDLENGLATFLLHRDYRDHYGREGTRVFARFDPRTAPFALGLESRWERHTSLPAGSPWALFGTKAWREQPLVGEGWMQSVALQFDIDSRSSRYDPSAGWWVRTELEHAYRSNLVRPALAVVDPASSRLPPDFEILPAEPIGRFTAAHIDLRRYNRLSPDARLNFRLLAGGSLDRTQMPPQRQHAFGGEGSLPGYRHFQQDCGARSVVGFRADEVGGIPITELTQLDRYYPRYGCDAFGLVQAEYRGRLSLRFNWDGHPGRDDGEFWDLGFDASPDWVVFFNAGRGWAYGDGMNEPVVMDLGVGLLLNKVGIYAAVPLTGRGGLNAFIRLGPRF
jgi:cytoskeletal protein CcmA (bactofilin family)